MEECPVYGTRIILQVSTSAVPHPPPRQHRALRHWVKHHRTEAVRQHGQVQIGPAGHQNKPSRCATITATIIRLANPIQNLGQYPMLRGAVEGASPRCGWNDAKLIGKRPSLGPNSSCGHPCAYGIPSFRVRALLCESPGCSRKDVVSSASERNAKTRAILSPADISK